MCEKVSSGGWKWAAEAVRRSSGSSAGGEDLRASVTSWWL